MMIKNLSIQRGATFIKLQWSAPKFHPYFYRQNVSCKLWQGSIPYLFLDIIIEFYATSSLVKSLRPGSQCEIRFKAVYNTATLDRGITLIASTPFGGNAKMLTKS